MRSSGFSGGAAAAVMVGALIGAAETSALAQTLIVGNDEKPGFDESGKAITREPGHDTLSVILLWSPIPWRRSPRGGRTAWSPITKSS